MIRACLILSSAIAGIAAAPPVIERQVSSPVTNVSREQLERIPTGRGLEDLIRTCPARTIPTVRAPSAGGPTGPYRGPACVQPDDIRMIEIYRLHNEARARFGALPLVWDWQMAVEAGEHARNVARTGELAHSSRENRRMIRENLLRVPRGWSPQQMIGRWTSEARNFVPGIYPNVSRTGNWADVAHFTALVWPPTTNIGCALARGGRDEWLVCRYSPPGNRDGFALGLNPKSPLYCQNRGGVMFCPEPEKGQGQGGQAGGGKKQDGENAGGGQNAGGNQAGGGENAGATRERPPPVAATPNDGISRVTGNCGASVIARVRIVQRNDPDDRDKITANKESHNLAQGFSEIVIPFGWSAAVDFKPDPNPAKTFPAPGRMDARWSIQGEANPHTAAVTGGYPKLARGRWDTQGGFTTVDPAERPTVQQHHIFAEWNPKPPTTPDKCSTGHDFTVTFAGEIPEPAALNLATFVGDARDAGFTGTRARNRANGGTREFHENPTTSYSRNGNIIVPIGIYWDLPDNCCDIEGASRKVIQFARAAIHGPNGRQGKGWGLDILPSELDRARGRSPTHNPTYSGHPRDDGNEKVEAGGAGGTSTVGSDVVQWDAPGMPKDLYDRLFAAQGPSIYRQQFLSLLVCRPPNTMTVAANLASAKVCRIAITTVRWDFRGQRGVERPRGRRGAPPPPIPYRQPVITVSFDVRDGNCADLRAFLTANGLLEAFEHPGSNARNLEILGEDAYNQLDTSVTGWEANPFDEVRFP